MTKRTSVLPWCGIVDEPCCIAIKNNKKLYTQCTNLKQDSLYCKNCAKIIKKNGDVPQYGTVEDRLKCGILEYIDPKGNRTIPWVDVLNKNKVNKEHILDEAKLLGWTIPECHFVVQKRKRGRPAKIRECVVNHDYENIIALLLLQQE